MYLFFTASSLFLKRNFCTLSRAKQTVEFVIKPRSFHWQINEKYRLRIKVWKFKDCEDIKFIKRLFVFCLSNELKEFLFSARWVRANGMQRNRVAREKGRCKSWKIAGLREKHLTFELFYTLSASGTVRRSSTLVVLHDEGEILAGEVSVSLTGKIFHVWYSQRVQEFSSALACVGRWRWSVYPTTIEKRLTMIFSRGDQKRSYALRSRPFDDFSEYIVMLSCQSLCIQVLNKLKEATTKSDDPNGGWL